MNTEDSPLKVNYKTTLEIKDVETGRQERKIWDNGELIEHEILKEGVKKEG